MLNNLPNIMEVLSILAHLIIAIIIDGLILIFIIWKIKQKTSKNKHLSQQQFSTEEYEEPETNQQPNNNDFSIKGAYHKRWMFTYNEKDAYYKLKPIAEELGYTVFAKVRLLDLLEPTKGAQKYKTYLYKVQAKHVDFVLCDQKLVAKHIIELDDSSHNREDRKLRDEFVDSVLKSVGYNIIHVKAINDSIREYLK